MGLGQMRTAVTLIRTVTEKDNEGFARKTDKTVAVFRAYREGRHGSVRWANLAAFSSATDLFRTRVLPGKTYDSLQDVSEQAFDAEHLNFKPFCDDIFGDG